MYGSYRKDQMNKNTSATANGQTSDWNEMKTIGDLEGNIYFDIVPGNYEITEKDTMDKAESMDVDTMKQEYVRLLKIQDINDQIMHEYDEKLDKQDKVAELKMTTADSIQAENDKWTKNFNEAKRKHKNYRDEVSRIRCEHFNNQAEAIMYEEKNEAYKPDIRVIVEELEVLRNKRKLFDEAMGADVAMITEEAEKLVLENEKNSEILKTLKSELNRLKISLLEDDPDEIEDGCGEQKDFREQFDKEKQESCVIGIDFDIDLVGIPGYAPGIDVQCAKPCERLSQNTTFEKKAKTSLCLPENKNDLERRQEGRKKKSVRFNTVVSERYESTDAQNVRKENLKSCLKSQNHHWIVADGRVVDRGMQEIRSSMKTKCDERINKIHRKQQATRMRQSIEGKTDVKSVKNNRSFFRVGREEIPKKKDTKINDENGITVAGISKNILPTPLENVKKSPSTRRLAVITKSKSIEKDMNEPEIYTCTDEIKHEKIENIDFDYQVNSIQDVESRKRQQLVNRRKQLPPINSPIPKLQNKKRLKVKSVTVENVLPCITANNKTNENGVIYDIPSSSPRPMYADKGVSKSDVIKAHRSAGKKDKISPSEAKAIEVGRAKAEKGIKLLGDKKLLSKRQNMIN